MRLTPIELGRRIIQDYQTPRFILEFQSLYDDLLYRNRFDRLAMVAPVRHGKTYFWSWMGISAYLMNHPERRVAYVSHANLADEFGYKIRQTITDYGMKFRGVKLAKDTQSKINFKTTAGGGLACYTAGNPISGFGFDFILVDDIQKKQEELDSELQRDKIWRWFYSDLINRLTPTGKIAAVMARRHPDDIMGRLKDHSALGDLPASKRWAFKTYKALTDGVPLWPTEWPKKKLEDTQKDYELAGNDYLFQCLYQGDPITSPAGLEWAGELFNGIEYDELPAGTRIKLRTVALDPSKGKNSKKGDFAALVHILVDETGTVWVDDCCLVRLPGPQLEDRFIAWMESHQHDGAAIESDMDGGSIAEMIGRKLISKNRLDLSNKIWNLPSKGLGDKSERLRRDLSRLLVNRKLKIKRTGHYKLLLSQFRNFSPHGRDHDDGPDAVSMGVRMAVKIASGG